MQNNITRDDIAEFIHDEFGLTKKDCNLLVNDIVDEIIDGLNKKKIVKIHNFGTFKLKRKNSRIGRNPKTKENVIIEPRNVITFIPSRKLLKKLNEQQSI
ncbi:MAG: Integration host factor subunit alpha [Alphaproteobacteria bacterium MarineAlpha5_Bin8]|nr:MAG: Integration host factor subunit alpha [Alphaproteobacteria bacterium MarineAlpha5_Bin8]PPR45893.1 MAG: Integration host factor subunit alpha [Alphaproteobacteria bacterium MarineAlpha5_Bin7]PPR53157.1 MAG: Integration host factor subunit alpha [Alphaproteobacteria bacterium MarineAlpha5_Bin6]|tara:strand:- start:1905 stop:2204 length:300 start_codon:yes stop_codon:yes gene_type:complete